MSDVEWKQVIERACLILHRRKEREDAFNSCEQNLNHVSIAKFIRSSKKLNDIFEQANEVDQRLEEEVLMRQ